MKNITLLHLIFQLYFQKYANSKLHFQKNVKSRNYLPDGPALPP